MITTTTAKKLMLTAGAILLVAVSFFIPVDAFAANGIGDNNDLATTVKNAGNQMNNIPRLIALGAYVIGTFMAVRALFAMKGFIESPDDNPLSKVLAFAAVAVFMILLPYVLGVITKSLDSKNSTVSSSATQFTNTSVFN